MPSYSGSSAAYLAFCSAIRPISSLRLYSVLSCLSSSKSLSPTPMICKSTFALSLEDDSINLGRSSAKVLMKALSSCCPHLLPVSSVTLRSLFFPLRSTVIPLLSFTFKCGGTAEPSRIAPEGRYFSPPSAHAMASRTEVLP